MGLKVLSFLIKFWHFKINYGYKIIFILQVFYGGESVSVNPKINNMHPGYKAAIYEFILISDSGIRSKFICNFLFFMCKIKPLKLLLMWESEPSWKIFSSAKGKKLRNQCSCDNFSAFFFGSLFQILINMRPLKRL